MTADLYFYYFERIVLFTQRTATFTRITTHNLRIYTPKLSAIIQRQAFLTARTTTGFAPHTTTGLAPRTFNSGIVVAQKQQDIFVCLSG